MHLIKVGFVKLRGKKLDTYQLHIPYELGFDLTWREEKEVTRMAEFVAIFYTVWFIRAPLPAAAPSHDIKECLF